MPSVTPKSKQHMTCPIGTRKNRTWIQFAAGRDGLAVWSCVWLIDEEHRPMRQGGGIPDFGVLPNQTNYVIAPLLTMDLLAFLVGFLANIVSSSLFAQMALCGNIR